MSVSQVKSNLAKLLATENLTVEHSNVSTASFNVETRVLQLPVWENITEDIYDLLVGHEVGHALYTPSDYYTEDVPQSFLNVIEDARIERMIKARYPGLSKSFYKGYAELNNQDFFELRGLKLSTMKLIDRINIYFKIGIHDINTIIPFSHQENKFIEMTRNAETFDDVVDICKKLIKYINESKDKEDINLDDVKNISETDQPDNGEQIPIEIKDSESDSNDANSQTDGNEGGEGTEPDNNLNTDYDEEKYSSDTDRAWNRNTKTLVDTTAMRHVYVTPPSIDWSECIEPISMFTENMNKNIEFFEETSLGYNNINIIDLWKKSFTSFKTESSKSVSYMVKEFEMKKQADQYNRSGVSKTGVLNTNKLFSYKWSEDVFKKNTILPNGKNHGLIMYIDWSGSMCDNMTGTVKQLINLISFCKKVNIPFQVFAFSDHGVYEPRKAYRKTVRDYEIAISQRFRLIELFNSKVKNSEFDNQLFKLWALMKCIEARSVNMPYGNYSLSGTPLNDTILAAIYVFNKFKRETKVDKVNTVFLTDGESNGLAYCTTKKHVDGEKYISRTPINYDSQYNVICIKDPSSGYVDLNINDSHDYRTCGMNVTTALIKYYKWMTGSNIIGFRLSESYNIKYIIRAAVDGGTDNYDHYKKMWRSDKCFVINNLGYDELYVLPGSGDFNGAEAVINASNTDSKSKIRTQFKKYVKTKMFNKIILSKFVNQIA